MTAMLASVTTIKEAGIALNGGADIIDLKDPASGALGRLETDTIHDIVTLIDGKRPVSATIGDQPMHPVFIAELVEEIASTGVDYIKIGLASDNSSHPVIRALKPLALKRQLIAVFFADQGIDNLPFDDLQHNGFTGVMLDTFDKSKGSLRRNVNPLYISDFIAQAQSKNLLCGLAGSLKLEDISQLAALKPDYLGFRGALCPDQNRTAAIDKALVHAVKNAIVHSAPLCSAATP